MSVEDIHGICDLLDRSPVDENITYELLKLLKTVRDSPITGVQRQERDAIGRAMHTFLSRFCSPRYTVPDADALNFLLESVLIANCMSALDTTTDPWIASMHPGPQNAFKTMVLYSARNASHVDLKSLLGQNPVLVSNWLYTAFQVVFSGAPNPHVMRKLAEFAMDMDDRLTVGVNTQEAYFGITYTGDMLAERHLKQLINSSIRRVQKPEITIDPDPTRIAVWAEYWSKGHSVYRSLYDYVKALKADHHLTLLHATRKTEDLDVSLFDEVIKLPFAVEGMDVSRIADAKFGAVVFCDIGMTAPSIYLSNLRLAPVQVMLTGHPVSTFGGEIDYFLSGSLVEDPLVYGNDRFYTEKLLSLPGYGATHSLPTYAPRGRKKSTDAVVISCSWYGQKVHHKALEALERAVARSGRKVLVRIFSGSAPLNHKGACAYMRDVQAILKSPRVELMPHLAYEEYMEFLEETDFAVDSLPFGGSNVASDFIHLRKPIVSLRGHRWFNRIGPAMVDQFVGADAHESLEQFEDSIHAMIVGDGLRAYEAGRMQSGVPEKVYEPQGAKEFVEWIKARLTG